MMRAGYKQTEIGVIPLDWKVGKLNKYWTVIDCKHVTAKFVESGFPLASIAEVQSIFINLLEAKKTTSYFYNKLIEGNRKPLSGDLIFSRNATVGEVAQVAEWHPTFAMGQDVCLLRKKNPKFSTDYLQQLLKSSTIKNQLDDIMVGSTFKRVNIEQIRNFVIPLPPLPEQTAIATVLSDTDKLLQAIEKKIAKKRLIKQGAMQELLRPKEGWDIVSFDKIFTFYSTSNYSKAEMSITDEVGCVHYGLIHAISNTQYNLEYGIKYYVTQEQAKYERVRDGDVIMVDASEDLDGINKSVEVCGVGDKKFIAGLHTYLIRDNNSSLVDNFRGIILNSQFVKHQMLQLAVGMKVFGVSKRQLVKIKIPLPPKSEQTTIATILSDMDLEIENLENQLAKYKQVKQGLMQNLLTGKIRLV